MSDSQHQRLWAGVGLLALLLIIFSVTAFNASAPRGAPGRAKPAITQRLPPALSAQVDALIVAPSTIAPVSADEAQEINASVPFSKDPNPAAAPYRFTGTPLDQERAVTCLAAAELYEAGDDDAGQRAVAQVILNRLRHPAYPKTVCGVVFQGQERRTGCQFTFTCDGAMARIPSPTAWKRARGVALEMLGGAVFRPVGYSTHYHTDWVVPYWSGSLDKAAALKTHLFFRWKGSWGRPAAFSWRGAFAEPFIAKLSKLSPGHRSANPAGFDGDSAALASALLEGVGKTPPSLAHVETLPPSVKIIAQLPQSNAFIVQFDAHVDPQGFPLLAKQLCSELPRCNLMAWSSAQKAPSGFPLGTGALTTMLFNYVQEEQGGRTGSFWNCQLAKPAQGGRCLGERQQPAPEKVALSGTAAQPVP